MKSCRHIVRRAAVNPKHVETLADCVAFSGELRAMTRHSMSKRRGDVGVLQKCSFEETLDIITDASF